MDRPYRFAALWLMCATCPAYATSFASPAAIDSAVSAFLGAEVGEAGGATRPVDRRLKLADCADGFLVDWYGRSGTTLQVSCPSRGWRIFVATDGKDSPGNAAGRSLEKLVQKGETVSLVYEGRGFVLTRQGEALEPGTQDQWIKIKPIGDNARPVRGQVVRPGTVRVSAE